MSLRDRAEVTEVGFFRRRRSAVGGRRSVKNLSSFLYFLSLHFSHFSLFISLSSFLSLHFSLFSLHCLICVSSFFSNCFKYYKCHGMNYQYKSQTMKIPITAGQGLWIHGLWQPKRTLSWNNVLSNDSLTFRYLHFDLNIAKELLHKMQPDISQWVKAGRVGLPDAFLLTPWSAHPIKDLKADLGDVIHMKWSAFELQQLGVTYSDLLEAGLTHETMGLFGFTLYDWSLLGFKEADANALTEASLSRLFRMTRADVIRCCVK